MSLACIACHNVESPSHSLRSYSTSSSENDGRCSVITNCLMRKASLHQQLANINFLPSSKVSPEPTEPPRLVRSRAVRRDIVQDWNFNESIVMVSE
ncbi:uncharacterized protein LOC141673789 [Apium graveolens]|uniref:uncharacterized protein LOC141673789 n=1 Tax=Apium graveolens TaxID=4045 RepID=UPI003D7A892E